MKSTKTLLVVVLLSLLALVLAGCISFAEDITPPPGYQPPTPQRVTPTEPQPIFPAVPPDPAKGETIFAAKCAPCHGSTGLGDGPDAANLPNPVAALGSSDVARQATPAQWFAMVSNGNLERYMPPFASLSAPQRWDVVAYALSLSVTPEMLAQGEAIYAASCAACHGDSGKGDGPDASTLNAMPVDFSDQAYMSQISAAEMFAAISQGAGEMPAFADQLSEDERWAVTAYLRRLSFAVEEAAAAPPAEAEVTPEATEPSQTETEATPLAQEADVASGTGTVEVVVVNPMGGDIPVGADVKLYAYENMQEIFNQSAPLGEDGRVVFADLPMRDGLVYIATTEYEKMPYGSDLALISADTTEAQLEIQVFETTSDHSQLVIERAHIFFDFNADNSLQVVMLLLLSNRGQQTVIPVEGEEFAVVFELPPGAENLSVQNSMMLRYFDAPNGFGIDAIRPSETPYEVTYAFTMPYDRKKLDVELPLPLDTQAAIVIAPQEGVKLKSDQLVSSGTRDLQGTPYATYTADNLKAGDTLRFTLSGAPKTGTDWIAGGEGSGSNLAVGLGAFGLALIGVGVYLWRRSNPSEDAEYVAEEASEEAVADSPDDLIDAILALDDLYRAGEIPEAAYQQRRGELKARLQSLLDANEEA